MINKILQFQAELAFEYNYRKLPEEKSIEVRKFYEANIPSSLNVGGSTDKIYSKNGTLIADGYNRIVVGDYGAFIEFNKAQANSNIIVKKGEEDRLKHSNTKYYWMTLDDESDIKIYLQKRTVNYADYRVGMYYVSPLEIKPIST